MTAKLSLPHTSLPEQITASESGCCQTTEEGDSICVVPQNGETAVCGHESQEQKNASRPLEVGANNFSAKVRSGVLFGVACLASPCCTPLYVPLVLVLLAGTPTAVWLSAHLGWVYGVLTLVSVISLVLAFRWWPQANARRRAHQSKTQIVGGMD